VSAADGNPLSRRLESDQLGKLKVELKLEFTVEAI
jgi:hypothetical protein